MTENLFETRYDLTKKSKLREYYESNKMLIYSSLFILLIIFLSYIYYQDSKEEKKIKISENYVQAKVYLQNGNKIDAVKILKDTILLNEPTYSTLSFFMILNENLIENTDEVTELFDHLLKNNRFDEEVKNLLFYKKTLYKSNYVDEETLLEETKKILNKNEESIWKAHTLFLLGDYYFSKKEYTKARDFYLQINSIKNLQPDFYNMVNSKLALIIDE